MSNGRDSQSIFLRCNVRRRWSRRERKRREERDGELEDADREIEARGEKREGWSETWKEKGGET